MLFCSVVIIHYNSTKYSYGSDEAVLPGQIWFINGVGECRIADTYLNNVFQSSKFKDDEPIVMYSTIPEPSDYHRVELWKFLKSAELVPDNSYKEFVQYKKKLMAKSQDINENWNP
jgi:hypothetical protein